MHSALIRLLAPNAQTGWRTENIHLRAVYNFGSCCVAVAHSPSAAAASLSIVATVMKITPEALNLKQKRGKRSERPYACQAAGMIQ